MRSRIELQRSLGLLLRAPNDDDRAKAVVRLQVSIDQFMAEASKIGTTTLSASAMGVAKKERSLLQTLDKNLATISDEELEELNLLLPWAAMTTDVRGRVVGDAWSPNKRFSVHGLRDRRHLAFNEAYPLDGKHVLEIGCFEGIHTLGCINLGARVTAVDGRIENVVKTLARRWAYNRRADVLLWDVESEPPAAIPREWDVLHHTGVLYHLTDPVAHLNTVLMRTNGAVILDTHVARDASETNGEYRVADKNYRFHLYREKDLELSPFSGLYGYARWLLVDDLITLLVSHGFKSTRLIESRDERNGRRVLIWGLR